MRRVAWLAAGALAVACAAWLARPGVDRDRIRIPHARHVEGQVECLACHEELYEETVLGATPRPREDKCLECHGEEKDKGNCGFCHTNPKHPATYPAQPPHLRVTHAKHIELVQEDCTRCHKALPAPFAKDTPSPPMEACFGSCHTHRQEFEEGRCAGCHVDLARFPLEPLVATFSHAGDFAHDHRVAARTSGDTCAKCHDQTFCVGCHAPTALPLELIFPERVDRGFIHRGDFTARHMMDARAGSETCARCHGESFCQSCHEAQNLTPLSIDPRNPHPAGWASPTANAHGEAARRDIASCAACHDDGPASICIDCHREGGVGGNPHPAAWTQKHPREEIPENGMCLYCHL